MPTSMTMYQVDAFTDRPFAGNPAAVLLLDVWLPEAVMQAIAGENNLAETAFALREGTGWELRWFTPTQEAEFCGHATLATAHVLATEHGVTGAMRFQTRAGELVVERLPAGYSLDLPVLPPEPSEAPEGIAEIFGAGAARVFRNAENLFVELAGEEDVRSFVPDGRIAALGPVGLAITARGREQDFVSRYFAPAFGIPEDPVTGSTHSTLVPYWAERLGRSRLSAFQASPRGGHLDCELRGDRVLLTGQAVTFMRAEIFLP